MKSPAKKAQTAAEALFGGGADNSTMPTVALTGAQVQESGLRVADLLVLARLASSKSDARRLIEGGGVFVGERKITDVRAALTPAELEGDGVILRKGKKSDAIIDDIAKAYRHIYQTGKYAHKPYKKE